MTTRHPDTTWIDAYAAGELEELKAMMLSVHLNHCQQCRQLLANAEQRQAAATLEGDSGLAAPLPDLDISAIVDWVCSSPPASATNTTAPALDLHGRQISLPPALAGLQQRSGPWHRVMDHLWRAPVTGHGLGYQIDFICMEPGGAIPAHSHKGREYTLVLEGSFSDEHGEYRPGDLLCCRGKQQHRPYSQHGCVCLAVIDAPLHFVSGLARLLNPFSQLFFKAEQ